MTTDAEASNPALGKVVKVTTSDTTSAKQILADGVALAAGYTNLYQGGSATGANIGANPAIGGVYNGYLPNVEGVSLSPGPSYVGNTKKEAPEFLTPHQGLVGAKLFNFPGRVIGQATFTTCARAARRAAGPGELDPGRRGGDDHDRLDRRDRSARLHRLAGRRHARHRPGLPRRQERGDPGRGGRQRRSAIR